MNLLEYVVLDVLADPYYQWGYWFTRVSYIYDNGEIKATEVMTNTLSSAYDIKTGYVFQQ